MQNPPGGARGKNKGAGGGRNPYQTNLEPADLEYNQNVASGADDRQFATTLARGFEILRCFTAVRPVLGNKELADETGLSRPTISRFTYTLVKLGYLREDPYTAKYRLGPAIIALGYPLLASLTLRQAARPLMQDLADECGASVGLGARDRLNMLYVENCEGQNIVALRVSAGSRIPLATSAMGRAYLAGLTDRERTPLIDQIIRKYPDDKAALVRGIERSIKEIEKRGFCLGIGDWRKDVNGAGAPLALPNGAGLFALNCGGPAYLLKAKDIEESYGPRLVEIASKVVASIGVKTRR